MSSGTNQDSAVARSRRGGVRTPSSTAKLDLILDGIRAGAERQLQLESSIDKLAGAVHNLAMSSVRYEEKVLQLETKTSKEIATQGEQLKSLHSKFESLENVVGDLRSVVNALEENRKTQQYWFRKILGSILVPVVIGIIAVAGWVYVVVQG
ncbi:MAG TPA: hypothetical protein DF774_02230 [Rheinheimera sp.]|uniref:hypothetical protein n=1 Tax=Rheinheimera sp. TaxID=1869214 RepID=UPI000EC0E2E6|nr:hypothetical protein [Rheinheimera sp.]HCU64558.1 hypothetical protein [Rheinheimera sp.]